MAEWKIDYGQRADQMLHVEIGDRTLQRTVPGVLDEAAGGAGDFAARAQVDRLRVRVIEIEQYALAEALPRDHLQGVIAPAADRAGGLQRGELAVEDRVGTEDAARGNAVGVDVLERRGPVVEIGDEAAIDILRRGTAAAGGAWPQILPIRDVGDIGGRSIGLG